MFRILCQKNNEGYTLIRSVVENKLEKVRTTLAILNKYTENENTQRLL